MAKILHVWELGAGIGHMANLAPIARELQHRGHHVTAAVRQFSHVHRFFDGIPCVAAPTVHQPPRKPIARASTFADLLYNNGCADADELRNLIAAWRSLFALVDPDIVVMEHSPLALLATQGWPCRSVVVGTGFYSPPDVSPLPDLCPWYQNYPDRLLRTEELVRGRLNDCLQSVGEPELPRLAALFGRSDANILATFREIDHYDGRTEGDFVGIWGRVEAPPPRWPDGPGPKIFAYLRPYPYAQPLIAVLHRLRLPTLIYYAEADHELTRRYAAPYLRIEHQPLDMDRVAAECDLAILYGSHDTTAAMLLAGVPMLQLPQHVEQFLVASRVERLGAGIRLQSADETELSDALKKLLAGDGFRRAGRDFADRYRGFDPDAVLHDVVDRIEQVTVPRRR